MGPLYRFVVLLPSYIMMKKPILFLRQGLRFFKNYVLKDPLFVLRYGFAYMNREYGTGAVFYNDQDFFSDIKQGKSIIRIGDGEIGMIHGRDIHYQKNTQVLRDSLKDMVKEYGSDSPYILSIPIFVNYTNQELKKVKGRLNCWLPLKVEFNRIFNKQAYYLDAHMFYYRDKMLRFFDLFLKDKSIIFVTNAETIKGIKESTVHFSHSHFIETPAEQAFDHIADIQKNIDMVTKEYPTAALVLSCGPASKYLAYMYSKKGTVCYDLGFGLRYLYDKADYSHVI